MKTSNGFRFQSNQVIKSLRSGDPVGHCQQPEHQYEVLMVDEQRLLAARLAEPALWFIAVWDVVVLF